MYADGIKVLHTAHRNRIALAVSYDLKFYLLPTADTLLDQNLMYRRSAQTVFRYLQKLFLRICYTASAAAKRKRRSYDKRQTYLFRYSHRVFYIVDNLGGYRRLAYLVQGVFKHLSVFRLVYRIYSRAEKSDTHLFEKAFLCKLHTQRQARLSAKSRQE